jgi:hypothetical protein
MRCHIYQNLSVIDDGQPDDTIDIEQSHFIDGTELRLDCEACQLLRRVV